MFYYIWNLFHKAKLLRQQNKSDEKPLKNEYEELLVNIFDNNYLLPAKKVELINKLSKIK